MTTEYPDRISVAEVESTVAGIEWLSKVGAVFAAIVWALSLMPHRLGYEMTHPEDQTESE